MSEHDKTMWEMNECRIASRFLGILERQSCIADIGCGSGFATQFFRDHFMRVIPVDICRPDTQIHGLVISDAMNLSLKTDSVEAVWLSHILEHMPNPVACLLEASRILINGGMMCVLVPHSRVPLQRGHLWNLGDFRFLVHLLYKCGFDISRVVMMRQSYSAAVVVVNAKLGYVIPDDNTPEWLFNPDGVLDIEAL